jgi:hypothetical protein
MQLLWYSTHLLSHMVAYAFLGIWYHGQKCLFHLQGYASEF